VLDLQPARVQRRARTRGVRNRQRRQAAHRARSVLPAYYQTQDTLTLNPVTPKPHLHGDDSQPRILARRHRLHSRRGRARRRVAVPARPPCVVNLSAVPGHPLQAHRAAAPLLWQICLLILGQEGRSRPVSARSAYALDNAHSRQQTSDTQGQPLHALQARMKQQQAWAGQWHVPG